MLYLLWMIVNICLSLYFIFICFKATKLIRERLGLFATLIFVFALFSFVCIPPEEDKSEVNKNTWSYESSQNNDSIPYHSNRYETILLTKNLMFDINLRVSYYKDIYTNEVIPLLATTGVNGVFGGYEWKPENISIAKRNDRSFEYYVSGTIKMSLLKVPLVHQNKIYAGIIEL